MMLALRLALRLAVIAAFLILQAPAQPASATGLSFVLPLSGPHGQTAYNMAIDNAGNFVVAGELFGQFDVDPSSGTDILTSAGNRDAYVAKYDPNGGLLWARRFGGASGDWAASVASDGVNTYVTGNFYGTVPFGMLPLISAGDQDTFVLKLDASGGIVWAKRVGGSGTERVHDIAVRVSEGATSVFVTGSFEATADFDPGPGVVNLVSPTGRDSTFILKLDGDGQYAWAGELSGATGDAVGLSIASDPLGNVYVCGFFDGSGIDFDPGDNTFLLTSQADSEGFALKLDASDNLLWAHAADGTASTNALGIDVDRFGNVVVSGTFYGGTTDFDPGPATFPVASVGNGENLFAWKFDADGHFVWVRTLGAANSDVEGSRLALDTFGDVYLTGGYRGALDFDPGPGQAVFQSNGGFAPFEMKLDATGGFAWARPASNVVPIPTNATSGGDAIALDSAGNIFGAGYFSGSTDFDPGPGVTQLTSVDDPSNFDDTTDVYLLKLTEDGPVTSVPGPQTTLKDTPRVFSATNGDRISVAGQEAGSGLGVTLTATHGALTLPGTAGLAFTTGTGTGNTQMTFTGTASAVNAALDGLRYLPDSGYSGPAEVDVTSFLATASGPLHADTKAVPITVAAGACTPRPGVQIQNAAGGGKLQVSITPTPVNGGSTNAIVELRFGAFQNAHVALNGQSIASGQTVTLPPNTAQLALTVERATAGQPTTVPLTVVDQCGAWQTFVGGGTSAGF
jgi:hypothetical protein